jgi:hypothetical protein
VRTNENINARKKIPKKATVNDATSGHPSRRSARATSSSVAQYGSSAMLLVLIERVPSVLRLRLKVNGNLAASVDAFNWFEAKSCGKRNQLRR